MKERVVFQVRVSAERKAEFERLAASCGLSLSEFARRAMDEFEKLPESVPEELERVVGVRAPRPSAVQVTRRPFKPDFK